MKKKIQILFSKLSISGYTRVCPLAGMHKYSQLSLKADTKITVRFREVSTLEKVEVT